MKDIDIILNSDKFVGFQVIVGKAHDDRPTDRNQGENRVDDVVGKNHQIAELGISQAFLFLLHTGRCSRSCHESLIPSFLKMGQGFPCPLRSNNHLEVSDLFHFPLSIKRIQICFLSPAARENIRIRSFLAADDRIPFGFGFCKSSIDILDTVHRFFVLGTISLDTFSVFGI